MDDQSDFGPGDEQQPQSGAAPEPAPSPELSAPAPEPVSGESTPPADAAQTPGEPSAEGDEAPVAPGTATGEGGAAEDPLHQLAEEASRRRLPQPEEERATRLLKEALLGGRDGVTRAIEVLPRMPWLVGVNAVSAVWQEMKPTSRNRLLAGLGRTETEAARRVRLSLARGLFKQDVPAALKIAVTVARDLRDKETGLVGSRDSQSFTGVFIGRAKPWVAQLPLADLKPAEADALVHVALVVVFSLPHPPATQLGILKWSAAAGRLAKLHPAALEAISKGLGRWSGKWRQSLYNEVKDLPEEIAKLVAPPAREPRAPRGGGEGETPEGEPARDGRAPREPREPRAPQPEHHGEEEEEEERRGDIREPRVFEDDEEEGEAAEGEHPEPPEGSITAEVAPPSAPKSRPVYESKTVPNNQQAQPGNRRERGERGGERADRPERPERERAFSLPDALRQIDQYVHGIRTELQQAQNKLRQREEEGRRGGGGNRGAQANKPAAPVIVGEPTPDELARLNVQLEARNSELQARLDELKEDAEQRAVSAEAAGTVEASSEVPAAETGAALRTLLQLKLQEDFEDFGALEKESPDAVVQQHYRALLRHVFEVLQQEGVPFKPAAPSQGRK